MQLFFILHKKWLNERKYKRIGRKLFTNRESFVKIGYSNKKKRRNVTDGIIDSAREMKELAKREK